jgi:putative membrane protein
MKNYKIILSIIYAVFAVFMITISPFGEPPYTGNELYLNNIGTLFLLALMILDIFKNVLSKLGFWGLFLFSVFHSIGSTWLYSFVPYNDWFINLFGLDLDAYFEFTRNHYDRFVHFVFGVLLLAATKDLIMRRFKFNLKQALLVAFLSIQVFSMIYELFEWRIAVSLSEGMAESYNGQQGDHWDAHKDMALAMLGSMITWGILRRDYFRKTSIPDKKE